MIYYLILFLVAIVFYVLLYFAAKHWHWQDITALALLFPALLMFFTLSFMVLGTYNKFRPEYEKIKADLEKQLIENQLLQDGIAISETGELKHEETWLKKVREDLGRKLFDRGRVWHNCFPGALEGQTVTVVTSQWGDGTDITEEESAREEPFPGPGLNPGPEGTETLGAASPADAESTDTAAPANVRPHGIEEKMVLYLFTETPLAQLDEPVREAILSGLKNPNQSDVHDKVPTTYLGEFTVTTVEPESIKLEPTIPLSESQMAVLNDPQTPWVLLEMMPVDSHEEFKDLSEDNKRALFPEQVVTEYLRDGEDANRDEDPPERTKVRVEFNDLPGNSPQDFIVDAPDDPPLLPSSDFNSLGQALPAWLRHGSDKEKAGLVQFEKGDVALFGAATAQDLIDREQATELGRVYDRQLRDYEFLFHKLYRQSTVVEDKIAVTRQDITKIKQATAKTLQSIDYREQETVALKHDKSGFEYERDQITHYHDALNERYLATRRQLSNLYQKSHALVEQLREESQRIEEMVNARTQKLGTLVQP